MTAITDIIGREILDSRGNPTVEVDVILEDGSRGRAAVPSGASTGAHEAVELRDGDKARFGGKGVRKAVDAVNGEIFDALGGMDAEAQTKIDETLIAPRRHAEQRPTWRQRHPRCVARGGEGRGRGEQRAALSLCRRHCRARAARADDEYRQWRRACRQPDRFPGIHDHAGRRADFCRGIARRRRNIPYAGGALKSAGLNTNVGDEGGFAPNLKSAEAALDFVMQAITKAGYKPGGDVMLALDCAATEFFKDGTYVYEGEGKKRSKQEQAKYLADLDESIRSSPSRTAWRKTTGRAGRF